MDVRGHILSVEANNGDSVFGLVLDRAVVFEKTALKAMLGVLDPPTIMELLTPSLLAALCNSVHVSVNNTVEALSAVFQKLNTRDCFEFLVLKLENDLTLAHSIAQLPTGNGLQCFLQSLTETTEEQLILLHGGFTTQQPVKPLHLAARVENLKPITSVLEPLRPGTLIPFVMTMKSGEPDIDEKFSDSLILLQKEDGFVRFLDCLHCWISNPNITSSCEALHASGLKSVLDFLCSCISKFCYIKFMCCYQRLFAYSFVVWYPGMDV